MGSAMDQAGVSDSLTTLLVLRPSVCKTKKGDR